MTVIKKTGRTQVPAGLLDKAIFLNNYCSYIWRMSMAACSRLLVPSLR
jgi:hypothetical protein